MIWRAGTECEIGEMDTLGKWPGQVVKIIKTIAVMGTSLTLITRKSPLDWNNSWEPYILMLSGKGWPLFSHADALILLQIGSDGTAQADNQT